MTASDAWTTRLYGIVPDPRLEAFLVSQQPAPALPGAVLAQRVHTWGAGRVGAEVGHALGEPFRPVRWFLLDEDPVDQRVDLALVFDPPAGSAATLNAADLNDLKGLEPRIEAMLAELARAGTPPALVHGDLHLGNVAERAGRLVVFDWTDAAIAHPFVDLLVWTFESDLAARDVLAGAYLDAWPPEDRKRLTSVKHLLPTFLHLYHAISYHELVANIEPAARSEMNGLYKHLTGLIAAFQPGES